MSPVLAQTNIDGMNKCGLGVVQNMFYVKSFVFLIYLFISKEREHVSRAHKPRARDLSRDQEPTEPPGCPPEYIFKKALGGVSFTFCEFAIPRQGKYQLAMNWNLRKGRAG